MRYTQGRKGKRGEEKRERGMDNKKIFMRDAAKNFRDKRERGDRGGERERRKESESRSPP